jgi:hypothetical protein
MTNAIYELLREDALRLASEFRKASIQGRGTSQEVADFREGAVQSFLERYFPFPHRIAKGKVRDSFGAVAASVDCVLCAPSHPYTVDAKNKFTLLFAEGVDAVVEVKPNIGDKHELVRGLRQGLTVKALRRASTAFRSGHPLEEWGRRVPYGIFAMEAKANPFETAFEVLDFYQENKIPPLDQADFIVVNGVCVLSNFVQATLNPWDVGSADFPNATGWFFEGWGEDALVGFLWRLHSVAHASMKMQEDVLPRYLRPQPEQKFRIVDLGLKHQELCRLRDAEAALAKK